MYYVYLIESRKTEKFYIGYTPDLKDRIHKHNTGKVASTKAYIPYELIYYEAYKSKRDAITREHNLKYFGQGFSRLKERIKYSIHNASFVRGKPPRTI